MIRFLKETDIQKAIFNSPNGLLDMQVHIKMLNKMGKTCVEKEGYLKITENSINTELLWDERSIRNSLLIFGLFQYFMRIQIKKRNNFIYICLCSVFKSVKMENSHL